MSDYTREQLFDALRKADAAGDTAAAKALTQRIKQMDTGGVDAVQQALEAGKSREEILSIAQQSGIEVNEADLDANLASRDAGGPTASVQEPSNWDHLADSAKNIGTGLAQGALMAVEFPMEVGRSIGDGISYAAENALEGLGFDGAAQWMRQGQERGEQARLALPSAQIEQAMPTPADGHWERLGAQVVGGLAVPFGPKAQPRPARVQPSAGPAKPGVRDDAAQIVAEGEKRGVPVMTTDVKPPQSGMGRWVKQTVPEKIPVAGTSGPREAQQAARQQAVLDAVEEFGGSTGRALFDDSETLPQEISRALTNQRSQKLTRLKNAKDGVIQSVTAPFTKAPNTVRAIDEQIRKLSDIDDEVYAPVIERLQRFRTRFTEGKTLEQIEGQRRLLGQMFDDPNLASIKDDGQKAVNAIYGPLRDDMGDFIEANLGSAARTKWQKANDQLSAMAGELNATKFRGVLRDADTTPEKISRILFSDAENVSDMQRLVGNLNQEGVRKVQGALITRAFQKAGGADGVSVERFLNNLNTLSGKIGVAFKGEDRQALEGLRRLLEATRRGAESGANIRTGEQNLPAVLGIGATQVFGFTGGVGTLGIGGLLARVYESPAVRNRIIGLAKTKPGSKAEADRLQAIMRGAVPIVNQWKDDMVRLANDNAGHSLAAESNSPEQERQ